jgi:hypothetical protein
MQEEVKQEHPVEVLAKGLRVVSLLLGLAMIAVGLYFALSMLVKVVRVIDDPAVMKEPVAKMAELIDGPKLAVQIQGQGQPMELGKLVAMGLLMGWAFLGVWVPLSVVYVGGRVVAWNFDERRMIRMVMGEWLRRLRAKETGADEPA